MSINHPAELDTALQITLFQTDLQEESLPDDCYDRLSGPVAYASGAAAPDMPEAMYLKLDAEADNGARYVKVPMTKDFSQEPNLGSDADPRLHEEDHELKYFTAHYTDASHVSSNQAYGVISHDKVPYKIFESRVWKEARYWKQYYGKMRRQATYECKSENLLLAPHYEAAEIAVNWFVPNIDDSDQPGWDADPGDHVDDLGISLTLAGTGTDAAWSHVYEQRLEEWAFDNLSPLDMPDGKQGFIHVMPSPQCRWLKHPTNTAVMGGVWRDYAFFSDEMKFLYPSAIGMIGRIVVVEDQRYPTLTLGGTASTSTGARGTAGGYTCTIKYRGMGRADDGSSDPRDKTSTAYQLGALYGNRSLCEWNHEKFHWEWEYEMYDKFYGAGVFLGVGIEAVRYNKTSSDSTTMQCDGYVCTPFAHPPRT
jgi:hypothetical protein